QTTALRGTHAWPPLPLPTVKFMNDSTSSVRCVVVVLIWRWRLYCCDQPQNDPKHHKHCDRYTKHHNTDSERSSQPQLCINPQPQQQRAYHHQDNPAPRLSGYTRQSQVLNTCATRIRIRHNDESSGILSQIRRFC